MPEGARELSSQYEETLLELLGASAAARPDACAIDFLAGRVSYAVLSERVERMASRLLGAGIGPGDRVGICMPNSPNAVVAFFAILRAGGIVVNYNPLYVERELLHQMRDSGTSLMLTLDLAAVLPKVAAAAAAAGIGVFTCRFTDDLPVAKAVLFRIFKRRALAGAVPGGHVGPIDEVRGAALRADIGARRSDIAVLQYTGGTTGIPKGVCLTHGNLLANASQVAAHMVGLDQGAERILGILPLCHIFALTTVMLFSMKLGATMILLPRFDRREAIATIQRTRPTLMPTVPTLLNALLPALRAGALDLGGMKVCISGGAPLPMELGEAFARLSGAKIVEGYGLSEASPVVACNPPEGRIKPGSVGLPLAGTEISIRSRDEFPQAVADGELGEIWLRGPQVMAGYWNQPDETDAVLRDGWLRTGDIGHVDAEGYVYVVDRIKDIILCSGFNVYPRMIEEALYRHAAVAEAVVIGVPDSYRGQAPKAYVVLRPDMAVGADELKAFLAGEISKLSLPREIEFCGSLPKTTIGKIDRKALVAQ